MSPATLAGLAALAVAAVAAAPAGAADLRLDGSELVVTADGGVLRGAALEGAVLALALEDGAAARVRIDRARPDPGRPEGDVWLYDLSVAEGAGWVPVCAPEADGAAHAVLQPDASGRIAILCTAGALAKCIRFGYRPWAVRGGVALEPYWRACVHMVRADYCGDGQPTTLDGMLIELHDRLGIEPQAAAPGLRFEAAWGAGGALCVAHPRVPQKVTLEALAAACPRLAGRLGPDCTEAAAAADPAALLFNASRGDGIPGPSP